MQAPLTNTKPVTTTKGRILTIGEIIPYDVQLAAAFAQLGHVDSRGAIWMPGGWELLNVSATWTDVAANQMIVGELGGVVETDLWVRGLKYSVQRPNAFAGSILKAQSDHYNALNPNINVQLIIHSYCKYFISPDFTPLENIVERFECDCPAGLVFSCGGNIEANFTNLRPLAADENPTIATLTFSAIRLPPGLYSSCSYSQAVAILQSKGFLNDQCDDVCK